MSKWIILGVWVLSMSVQAQQTNVLLIIADDLGIESLTGFNDDPGASFPPTPTIDSLQSGGITFSRFYAYSTCSPTRGSILTGRYSFRTGIVSPNVGDYNLQPNDFTLPEALTAAGVISNRMAHIGKWHLGTSANSPSEEGGWPHFSGALGGGLNNYTNWTKTVNGVSQNGYTVYATSDNVNDAMSWIDGQGTNSWLLWLAFNAPHTPLHRPPSDLHSYSLGANPGPRSRRHYEAMVEAMDTEIARLLSHVDLSMTTVIFMGDNGTPGGVVQPPISSDHCKGSIYDGGIRVPLVVAGAAVRNGLEGTVCDGVLHSVDLYSTILELFGVAAGDVVPEELVLDSRSFAGVLRGEPYIRDSAEITSLNVLGGPYERAIVDGDYKFIDLGTGTQEFYNVALDFPETNNLLEGVLSPAEQSVYESLTNRIET